MVFFFLVVDWAMAAIMVVVVVMRWKSRSNRTGVRGIGDGGGGCGTPGSIVVVVTVSGGPRLEDVHLLFHKYVHEPSARALTFSMSRLRFVNTLRRKAHLPIPSSDPNAPISKVA
jgi:hypothetical protein